MLLTSPFTITEIHLEEKEAVANPHGPPRRVPQISICSKEHPDRAVITPAAVDTNSKYYLMLDRLNE